MESYSDTINQVNVTIAMGDMTRHTADAFLVPQFAGGPSYGGVGGAVADSGAEIGMEKYHAHVKATGEQEYGSALLTPSGGGNSSYLLHVVSVGSERDQEFETVFKSVYNALQAAHDEGLTSVAAPALGTGIIGQLQDEQSARAMLSAVNLFSENNPEAEMSVSVVIFGSAAAYNSFLETLQNRTYQNAEPEVGQRDFNMGQWVQGMQFHADRENKYMDKIEKKDRIRRVRRYRPKR